MRVSLITTVRNEAATVGALAAAIAAQTLRPDEWLVVDGGSRDDTAARLSEAATALGLPLRLEVVPGNIARGRNAALAAATGDVVAATDAGCVPEPAWLESLIAPLAEGTCDASAGATRVSAESAFGIAQWTLFDQLWSPRSAWRAPTLSSRSLAFRRELALASPYPEWLDHGEDRWLLDVWRRRGVRLQVVDGPRAGVVWSLRSSCAGFLRQHFLYMRGDGKARMRGGRHALRLAFHTVLLALATAGAPGVAALVWAGYCGATVATRWPAAASGASSAVRIRSLLWLPPLLAAMDAAKIAGYLAGRGERALGLA